MLIHSFSRRFGYSAVIFWLFGIFFRCFLPLSSQMLILAHVRLLDLKVDKHAYQRSDKNNSTKHKKASPGSEQ